MAPPDGPASDAAACDFLEMFDRDRAGGRVRTRDEYLARFPGFEERVGREFASVSDSRVETAAGPATRRLGRYRLLRELGRGGQAIVHLAHDEVLDRQVALKVLADGAGWLSQARRDRLQREASALARLDHPGICAIHEADLGGDVPFLAMRYVAGETLAVRLQRARTRPEPESDSLLATLPDRPARIMRVLELGETIARALHSAHESGVVHRDIKPQNVMLSTDDQPVILDFGIAQTENAEALVQTRTGELFGSLAYLAPERLAGDDAADRRGDVYALGVTLYECLTLRRPFEATTAAALLREIGSGGPHDASRHNRAIPRDVALALQTALEPEPARRYATALALAEDLRRLRHHEPIAARPIGAWLRLRRWMRRHPVFAASAIVVVLGLVVSTSLLVQLATQRQRLLAWQQVLEALSSPDQPTAALGRTLDAAPHVPESRLNGPLIELLTQCTVALELAAERLGGAPMSTPFFAADDRRLVVPTAGGELVEVDAAVGSCTARHAIHAGERFELRVATAAPIAVTSGLDGRVRCFDTRSWSELPLPAAVARSNDEILGVAEPNRLPRVPVLTSDGQRLLLLGYDGTLIGTGTTADARTWRVHRAGWYPQQACFVGAGDVVLVRWARLDEQGAREAVVVDSTDGSDVARLDLAGQESMCCAAHPTKAQVCIAGHDGAIRVFDTATWQCTIELHAGGEELRHVYWVGFTPTGDELVTLGFEGLTVWDLETQQRRVRVASGGGRPFHVGAFSDDGTGFATVVKDGTVRVFDVATWAQISTSRWSHRYPEQVVWNHAGTRVAFQDGRLLQVVSLQAPAPEFRGHNDAITSLAFFADGRRVLTTSRDATAAVVDLGTGRAQRVLPHPAPVRRARLSADEQRILTACDDGVVRLFAHPGSGQPLQAWSAHTGAVNDVVFLDDDRRVLSIGHDGDVHVFDAASGAHVVDLRSHRKACLCVAVDPRLGLIATGGADRQVLVHDAKGAFLAALDTLPPDTTPGLDIQGNASALAFDTARRRLVVANRRDTLAVFNVDGWRGSWVEPRTEGQQYSAHVALVSGGAFYATAHSGVGDWTFVDAETLSPRDVGAAWFPAAIVAALRFSPDARLLLVAARDDSVSLWDLARGERHLELRGRHGGIRAAEFSPDGAWVATGSQDGVLRVWPVRPLPFARAYHARACGEGSGSRK